MKELELKLDHLENCIRLSNKAFEILFFLMTSEDRGQTLYNSLTKIESSIRELHDESLLKLYHRLFKSTSTPNPYLQIHPDDYFAFLQRLGNLLHEVANKANEADIDLRAAIGLQSVIGIWGGKDWRSNNAMNLSGRTRVISN